MTNNLKKRVACVGASLVMAGTALGLASCGNYDIIDTHFSLNYAVLEENGKKVLHTVEQWSDSSSDSVCIKTSCCKNYIWTSSYHAILYEAKPDAYAYDEVCTSIQL